MSTSRAPHWSSDEAIDSYPSPPKSQRQIIKAKRSLPSNRLPPPSISTHEQSSPEISPNDEPPAIQTNQKKSRNLSANQRPTHSVNDILDEVKQELRKIRYPMSFVHCETILDEQPAIVTIEDDNSKSSRTGFSFANYGTTTTDFQFASEMPSTFATRSKSDVIDRTQRSNSIEELGRREDDDQSSISHKPEENILFCERAELFSLDSSTDQFEERGIGQIKIFEDKTNHLVRIAMQGDGLSNVDQPFDQQMELKPHPDKPHAYLWSNKNTFDGESNVERFCVKFATSDIAERFLEQFNSAKDYK